MRVPSSGHDDTVPAPDLAGELEGELPAGPSERYRHGPELGRGGMGRVVEAFDTQLGRTVALKEVLPKGGPGVVRRFRREVEITARLEHASIVPLYDSGTTDDGRPFYVMRKVTGRPLDELIARARGLEERLALLPAVLAAIDAIAHAHRRGVIHRDLKPANILVGELGETVVIDWGLAKVIGEEDPDIPDALVPTAADSLKTQIGSVFGTPGFMAPEQARGEQLGPRSDVYALGATLYQLLVGRPPVRGDSATGMIESTLKHAIEPVREACPGAPPELVAIVDKALAAQPDDRYGDAGALGEDVRRFTTGQLVAAHSYTRRQRLARFARRHRAALVVAAGASVAVAALAWISVQRILDARDAADDARQVAELRRKEAEQTRDKLAAQRDALVIEQARELLDKNPTQALALLKQLPAATPRLDDARAIAKAATMRGVAWAMQTPDAPPIWAQLSLDATRVAATLADGSLAIWDLESRKQLVRKPGNHGLSFRWVSGNRLLGWRKTQPPELLEPASGNVTPAHLPPLARAEVDDAGMHVAFIDLQHHAGFAELATGAQRALGTAAIDDISISPGGEWAAAIESARVAIYDASGKELAHHDGEFADAVFSRTHVAALYNDKDRTRVFVLELAHADAASWIEVPTDAKRRVVHLFFRGSELVMIQPGALLAWRPGMTTPRRSDLPVYSAPAVDDARDGVMVTTDQTATLYYRTDTSSGAVPLPSAADHVRLVGRRGHSRVVALATGAMYVYDLDAFVPGAVREPAIAAAAFVDAHTLFFMNARDHEWVFRDLDANTRSVPSFPPLMMAATGMEVVDHDIALIVREAVDHLFWVRVASKKLKMVVEAPHAWGRPIEGDAIVYTAGDNKISAIVGDGEPAELATLEGRVTAICSLGKLELAAISARGELIRASLATGKIERTHVSVGEAPIVAKDLVGRIVIASGPRLSLWDGGVREVAKLDQPIEDLQAVEGGIVAVLADQQSHFVALPGGATRQVLPAMLAGPVASTDGREAAAIGVGAQLTVVDLPSLARWTLPVRYEAKQPHVFGFAPDGKLFQASEDALILWTLPEPGADLASWLDEQTDATVTADGILVWPWQVPRPPG